MEAQESVNKYLNKILLGDCRTLIRELPDECIDCCISSPPYWGQRDYNVDDQIGQEESFMDYVNTLVELYTEVKRVLKKTGTCFVNLGDTYGGSGAGTTKNVDTEKYIKNSKQVYVLPDDKVKSKTLRNTSLNKCLLMLPERFAIQMIDNDWVLRNQIIWHKLNQMPTSTNTRFTVDFEKIFFFVKNSKEYYFKQQLEPYTKPMNRWGGTKLKANGKSAWDTGTGQSTYRERNMRPNPDGRNMRTVWSVNTTPFPETHFATFPKELVRRMLKAGCPENGIVLDPFIGSGTTAVVARDLDMNYIGFDANAEYVEMSKRRIRNNTSWWNK